MSLPQAWLLWREILVSELPQAWAVQVSPNQTRFLPHCPVGNGSPLNSQQHLKQYQSVRIIHVLFGIKDFDSLLKCFLNMLTNFMLNKAEKI